MIENLRTFLPITQLKLFPVKKKAPFINRKRDRGSDERKTFNKSRVPLQLKEKKFPLPFHLSFQETLETTVSEQRCHLSVKSSFIARFLNDASQEKNGEREKKRKKETPRFKISEKDEKGDAIRDRGSRDDKKRTIAREYFT